VTAIAPVTGYNKPTTMDFTLYNTMSRQKERFDPLVPGKVSMYTCGPTVYNYAHIGNLRTFLFEDLLARALRLNGFDVTHVMNITDVGHMTSDADAGEDKMAIAAQREKKTPWEIARFYEDAFKVDMQRLGNNLPTFLPRATENIPEMIAIISALEAKGFTYATSEGIYFDTSRDPDYGKLERNKRLDEQIQGVRDDLNIDPEKRHPADFVLWFLNKPTHIMKWESPWGTGYPGWHIECSAMAMKYLGETFDIHCGGIDHIPVHNTNEIAQSECATGHVFARYWMHAAFLNVRGKMSKSKGGFVTVQTLVDSGYDPLAYRFLCLQAHYRSELEMAWVWDDPANPKTGRAESLDNAQRGLHNLYERIARTTSEPLGSDDAFQTACAEVFLALNDDLNVSKALATLHTYGSPRLWKTFDAVLALDIEKRAVPPADETPPADVLALVDERQTARRTRDFGRSDELRERIAALGWEVADSPQGPTVKRRS
jgi:cysteinyl-tRNA synthetase